MDLQHTHARNPEDALRGYRWYRTLDAWAGMLLCAAVVIAPWILGTSSAAATWVLNIIGYANGFVLLAKHALRRKGMYFPPRWGEDVVAAGMSEPGYRPLALAARWMTRCMFVGTVLVLCYTAVSALNWRASTATGVLAYHDKFIPWLPHSYAADLTWGAFWRNLALACHFWGMRDWLLGMSLRESGVYRRVSRPIPSMPQVLPERLTWLLWALCLNGTLLALVSILQQQTRTPRLLWFLEPSYGGPDFHFGPFNYRGNAAQFFNLLWPVTLAFWWARQRPLSEIRRAGGLWGTQPHMVLLPCLLVEVACPVISSSHGGAVVATMLAIVALALFALVNRSETAKNRLAMLAPFALGVFLAMGLGWTHATRGFLDSFADDLGDRAEIHENARKMASEFEWFGSGPGTFRALYALYRGNADQDWANYAHNDWLEFRITYGWLGFAVLLVLLLLPFVRWWCQEGIKLRLDFVGLVWLAMLGCLLHAMYDFPFQIYSIRILFLTLCAVCFCSARGD